jgi:hypothetical protein
VVAQAAAADVPAIAQATLGFLLALSQSLDAAIDELKRAIVADHRRDLISRLAASVPGVGALAASATLASAPAPGPSNPAAISPLGLARRPRRTRPAAKRNSGR